jgi:UPF0755 protein
MPKRRPSGRRKGCLALCAAAALLLAGWIVFGSWFGPGPLEEDSSFVVPNGAGLTAIAERLQDKGIIRSAGAFALRVKVLGDARDIRAGEFLIPARASPSQVLSIITSDDVVRRFVTIPEGMPSIMVHERLMAIPELVGPAKVPAEGSVLPDSYAYQLGDPRSEVIEGAQAAMRQFLNEQWAKRGTNLAVKTPQETLILASIVEKETGKPSERRMVAGLYSNRLKIGMPLQADPTIIYPITKGKPLGRRIRQSEIRAVNGYNTYAMSGLPRTPITNPGRQSIEAVLHPAETRALYMVADGNGGHVFAETLDEHNRNVAKWFAIRRKRGEM